MQTNIYAIKSYYLLPLRREGRGALQSGGAVLTSRIPPFLLDGRCHHQVGVRLGKASGKLEVGHVPRHSRAHPSESARSLLVAPCAVIPPFSSPVHVVLSLHRWLLVDPCVEDGAVHYLRFRFFLDLRSRERHGVIRRQQQVAVPLRRIFAHSAVQLVRIIRGLAGWRRAVQQAGKLLGNTALPAIVFQRCLPLIRHLF